MVPKWRPKKKTISKGLNWLSHKLDEAVAASWEDIRGGGVWNGITLPCHENFHQPCQKNTKLDPCSFGTPHRRTQIGCFFSQRIVLPKWKPKNGTKMEAPKKRLSQRASTDFPITLMRQSQRVEKISGGRGLKWYYPSMPWKLPPAMPEEHQTRPL